MGSTSALVIGSNVEAQLAPYKYSEDTWSRAPGDLSYLWWKIGPYRYANWTDWKRAFKLKQGFQGEAKYVTDDQPAGLAYSANKGAIDFEGMRKEIEFGAGLVWDFARNVALPDAYAQPTSMAALQRDSFGKELDTLLAKTFPDAQSYQFAHLYFVSRERLHYSRERYIDFLSNNRFGDWRLIVDGNILEPSTFPETSSIRDPLLQLETWLLYVYNFICATPEDTLISQVVFKQ